MIYFYSGTPGSGKSLNVARDIYNRLNRNKKYPNVIANFTINEKMIKNKKANFIYKDNSDLTVEFLVNYAHQNHKLGIENQTLVVVDECSVIWNSRDWNSSINKTSRGEWLKFFVQHRKLGYNFILISQNDRQIDRQIRSLFEYEINHRKVNNFKIGRIMPVSTFIAVSKWYGVNEKLGIEFFVYRKKWGKFYDSYGTFELDESISNLISDEYTISESNELADLEVNSNKFNLLKKIISSNYFVIYYIIFTLFLVYFIYNLPFLS